MIYTVYHQRPPKRDEDTDNYRANLREVGTVEAADGIEAIRIAKAKRMSPWPIVQERGH